MAVTVHPLDCGRLTANLALFERGGADAPITLPVPAWLVRHPRGTVVFDTGLHPDMAGPSERLALVSNLFEVAVGRDGLVGPRLEAVDVDPGRVDVVILSHLHFDHAGGLAMLPDAHVVVQAREWAAGADPAEVAAALYLPDDYELGHEVVTVDGEHDVFGDGRVTCLPTPGHTAGHQSLRVRTDERELVLTADCTYFTRTLDGGALPPFGYDQDAQARSRDRLRAMRDAGATVVPGHDPDVWAQLPAAL
jgi:glyoxylase-like metal-dependent hydrolase (beta-lactamase superfamily II)